VRDGDVDGKESRHMSGVILTFFGFESRVFIEN